MKITLIAAIAKNGVIGKSGTIPWHLPADFKYFKMHTLNKPVIMGRNTFDSLTNPKPLPSRLNVIISRTLRYEHPDCKVFASLDEALVALQDAEEVMIAGGAMIYKEALKVATAMRLTWIDVELEGDTFFPTIDWSSWQCLEQIPHAADEKNKYAMNFCYYERKN